MLKTKKEYLERVHNTPDGTVHISHQAKGMVIGGRSLRLSDAFPSATIYHQLEEHFSVVDSET